MSRINLTLFFLFAGLIMLTIQCSVKVNKEPTELSPEQQASAIRSIDPAYTDYADLQPLQKAIGNARIVLLGEQTHGEGSTFLAKTRIIQFLHESMGFEVLAFESGFYDCTRIWENTRNGGQLSQEVIGSLFYMYATSKQMQPLFGYIQSKLTTASPLLVAGFESQHSGAKARNNMFTDFETFLQQRDAAMLDQDWDIFKQVSLATFAARSYRPKIEEKKIFFNKLEQLKRTLPTIGETSVNSFFASPGFWYRVTCSIESQALRYWEMVSGNEVSVRDLQMAENLIWLAEKAYPGKKIIVWAHNAHIAKNTSRFQPIGGAGAGFFASFVPMGATIANHFGVKAYSIGFSAGEGNYMDYTNDQIITVPPRKNESLEEKLSVGGYENAFVDYRTVKGWWQQFRVGRLTDFGDINAVWPGVFDGLFFIRKTFAVDR